MRSSVGSIAAAVALSVAAGAASPSTDGAARAAGAAPGPGVTAGAAGTGARVPPSPAATAGGTSRGAQRAAVRAYVERGVRLERARHQADRRAQAAAAAVRKANRGCAPAWKAAPPQLREDLGTLWFESVSGGLWSVDRPLFARWIRGLNAAKAIRRSPQLAEQARRLRADLRATTRIYTAVHDACALVERWADAGFSAQARPRALDTIDAALAHLRGPAPGARRLLARYGPADAPAGRFGDLLSIDEPDERVEAGGCDPIGGLLLDHYAGCGGH